MTPVGETACGKLLQNPNVMAELGYAMKVLGNERIVLVMNTAEGAELKHLPFDLRHWLGPVMYSLRNDVTDERRAEVAIELKEALRERIVPSLRIAAAARREDRRRSHRAPELSVRIADGVEQPYPISQVVDALDAKSLQEVRAETPLQPLPEAKTSDLSSIFGPKARTPSAFAGLGRVKPVSEWSREEVEGYNGHVEGYYRRYDQFLEARVEYERLMLRTFELKLSLVNAGTQPATDIDIYVTVPEGIILYEEDQSPREPEPPEPPPLMPLPPGTGYVTQPDWSDFDPGSLKLYSPWLAKVFPDQRKIHFSVKELKHHHAEALNAVLMSFASETDIASFEVSYVITANEPIDPVEATIRFQIEREDTLA